jgi:RPA family protein
VTNTIKLNNSTNNSITEIRIEKVLDVDLNFKPYWYIYCIKDTGERIEIGKSNTRPQCYKQVAIYK